MHRWLPKVLKRIHDLAAASKVRLTYKAEREALTLGFAPEDVRDVVTGLSAEDSAGRLASQASGEWMYVWKAPLLDADLYVKLILRNDCVVVSFHEDEGGADEEAH